MDIIFTSGSFDGKDDSYNYKPKSFTTINDGKKYLFRTKFLSVNYEPKYDTKDWEIYRKWKELRDTANKYNI